MDSVYSDLNAFYLKLKYLICFFLEMIIVKTLFRCCLTLPNSILKMATLCKVVHNNVEINNVYSALFDIVNSNIHIEDVVTNSDLMVMVDPFCNVISTTRERWSNVQMFPGIYKPRFIKFDIVEFYPSISEELLNRSISFARSITTINDSVINIVHLSRKFLLFNKTSAWVKKGNDSFFGVTMRSSDGAEIFVSLLNFTFWTD